MISIFACNYSVAHAFLADWSKGGSLPDKTYLINVGLIFTLVIQITFAVIYQLLSMGTRRSKSGVGCDLTESLSFKTCFVYYSFFLILRMINPLMYPVHWVTLSGRECIYVHVSVCALLADSVALQTLGLPVDSAELCCSSRHQISVRCVSFTSSMSWSNADNFRSFLASQKPMSSICCC